MDDLRPDALATVAARVVAWHNRHPLARRIKAEQVQSVGYVALPFLAPADKPDAADARKPAAAPPAAAPAAAPAPAGADQGKSLRERALERAQAQPAGDAAAAQAPARTGAAKAGSAQAPAKPAKAAKALALKAAFSEDFIAPLSVARVASWAAQHGALAARAPRDGPLREVAVDRALAGARSELLTLYALTAMVEVRGKRVRMLLGGGDSSSNAVIGNRLWSTPRLAAGSALLGSSAAAAALAYVLMPAQPLPAVATPAPPSGLQAIAPAASIPSIRPPALRASAAAEMAARQAVLAASAPQHVASGSAPHAPEVAAHAGATPGPAAVAHAAAAAAPKAAASAVAAAPAAPPLDVEPTLGRITLPSLGLPKGDGSAAALQARRQAALATAGLAGAALPPPTPMSASAAAPGARLTAPATRPGLATPAGVQHAGPPTPAAAPGPAAPASAPARPTAAPKAPSNFAVSSRLLRTRAEAEQTQSAMRALLAASGQTAAHVELVPAGEDWRVVGWPFAQRAQADSASKLLASRGMRVTVIDF